MTPIPLTPAESTMIAAMGYDAPTRTLRIQFAGTASHAGSIWDYADVDPSTFAKLRAAPSIGGYFLGYVKDRHAATRVDQEEQPPAAETSPT